MAVSGGRFGQLATFYWVSASYVLRLRPSEGSFANFLAQMNNTASRYRGGKVREWLREAAEAEDSAAALRVLWAMCLACDAACLPFGMVGELRRKLGPIALAVLLLFMGVGIMNIRVSAEFPSSRQRAAKGLASV